MMMLDSLADAYVRRGDTPFFSSLIPSGRYADIESLFAFEGIMAAVITGHKPSETGVFARFAYGPSGSVMRRNPLRVLNFINRHAYFADGERRDGRQNFPLVKAVRKVLKKYWITGGFNNLTPYGRLPLALAHQFRYSMVLGAYDRTLQLNGFETLFGRAAREGRGGLFHYGRLADARARLERTPDLDSHAIIFLHTWSHLDTRGHDLGPESDELRAMTRDCDAELSEFLPWLQVRLPDASFILFADHGMHPVTKTIDVGAHVSAAIDGRGPLVFVDSTAVRAWGSEDELRALSEDLSGREGVSVLSEDDLRGRGAFFPGGEYGQLFAAAEPGFVFAPDYFAGAPDHLAGCKPWKGMHGYFRDTQWLRPSLLWFGPAFETGPAGFTPRVMTDIWKLAMHAMDAREGNSR